MEIKCGKLTNSLLTFALFVIIYGQRLVITIGKYQFPIILIVIGIVLAGLSLTKRLAVNRNILKYYVVFLLLAVLSALFSKYRGVATSINSFIYFILLYLPFIFYIKSPNGQDYVLRKYQSFMLLASAIGIVQFFSQYIGISYQDLFDALPKHFVQEGFQPPYEIEYGSKIYRSNAVFFLEASFFSQFVAIAIIIEYMLYKRKLFLATYLLGLVVSFSGTGILLLLFFLTLQFRQIFALKYIVGFTAIISSIFYAFPYYIENISHRLLEIGSEGSSAFIRFVAPFLVLFNAMKSKTIFFGMGSGAVDDLRLPFTANFSVIPKVIIEYGIIVSVFFCYFILVAYLRNKDNKKLALSILFMYFFLAGNLMSAQVIYFGFVLGILSTKQDA